VFKLFFIPLSLKERRWKNGKRALEWRRREKNLRGKEKVPSLEMARKATFPGEETMCPIQTAP